MRQTPVLLAFVAIGGCLDGTAGPGEGEPVDRVTAPIVGGERVAGDEPAVVLVYDRFGGLCTGTLIAPRVVLTAKHCVQQQGAESPTSPSRFVIGIGDTTRALSTTFNAQSVSTTPGSYSSGLRGLTGIDVAVIVLTTASSVTPIEVRRESPTSLIGADCRAIGFGQTPSGGAGVKYATATTVSGFTGNVIYTPPTICQGDSGGPLLDEDGRVFGVASFGTGDCGSGINGYNRIDRFLEDIIDPAILESGSCLNDGAERCDGHDNDCDDGVDEGCRAIGEPCFASADCVGGPEGGLGCEETGAGRICTRPCDPVRPLTGCGPDLFCGRMAGCDGLCVPGVPGALGNDAPCLEDLDCASLHCSDPGDGTRRCLTPCQGDAGQCLAGEVCAAVPGACGGCVASGLVIAARGLGEPCAASTECGSGLCYTDLGGPYCSRSCAADEECGEGFHCRAVPGEAALCIRGRREGIGTPCLVNEDCHEGGFCATLGDVSWCTDFCPPVECPTGYSCTPVGELGLCAPDLGVPGAGCTSGEQCLSGVCLAPGVDEAPICTRFCGSDAPCNPGFECRRPTDGTEPFCVPTSPLDEGGGGGGCSVAGAPGAASSALLVLVSLLLGCCIRRRW